MSIKQYANHKELLADPEIEAVVIAVPLNVHAQIAIDALNAGKHVLAEKLMVQNITQCKEMIKVAEQNKKLLAIGHQRHYSVLYENANELIREGLLGDIKFIRASWHRNNSFPNSDSWNKPVPSEDKAYLAEKIKEWGFDSVEQLCRLALVQQDRRRTHGRIGKPPVGRVQHLPRKEASDCRARLRRPQLLRG